jgi:hypothetical protein
MNWVRVFKEAAGNQQIGDILSCPDDVIVWRQHSTSYARRLFESDAGAFSFSWTNCGRSTQTSPTLGATAMLREGVDALSQLVNISVHSSIN